MSAISTGLAATSTDDGRNPHLSVFQRTATIPIIALATMSTLATSTLLTYLAVAHIREWRRSKSCNGTIKRESIGRQARIKFRNQGFFWLVNLFFADLLQSLGWLLSCYNLARDDVLPSFACSVQGFFINSGDVGSSIWSLVIAIHTVLLLAGGQRARVWAAEKSTGGKERWILAVCIWLSIVFLGLIGPLAIEGLHPEDGPFYNSAGGGWCWIGKNYPYERIFFHYCAALLIMRLTVAFVFIDMIALTFLYCWVFFYIRYQLRKFSNATSTSENQISSNHELEIRFRADLEALPTPPPSSQIIRTQTVTVTTQERRPSQFTTTSTGLGLSLRHTSSAHSHLLARKRMLQVARSLLWYPLIYLIVTLPLTIGRLATFANDSWAEACIFVGAAFFASGGFCNVFLYTTTRKGIISWKWFGWRKKYRHEKPCSFPVFSPRSDQNNGGPFTGTEKLGSPSSTMTSASNRTRDPKSVGPDLSSLSNSRSLTLDTDSDIDLSGVDFTHSTGFDVIPGGDADKLVHDRYCIQTRIDDASLPGVGTVDSVDVFLLSIFSVVILMGLYGISNRTISDFGGIGMWDLR